MWSILWVNIMATGWGKRGSVRNRKNIFAGIIKCEHCNSAMVSMKAKSRNTNKDGQEYRYLFVLEEEDKVMRVVVIVIGCRITLLRMI